MTNNISPELLADVRNHLQITWRDVETDRRITSLISMGRQYLNQRAGTILEYEEEGSARTLLFEYVRYARDNAMDVFENNYQHLIISLRAEAVINSEEGEADGVENP